MSDRLEQLNSIFLPLGACLLLVADDVLTSATGETVVLLTIYRGLDPGALPSKKIFAIKRLTVNKR